MKTLAELEPKIVWKIFDRITEIPRPSKHEERIRAFLIEFAEEHHLEYRQDAKGNLVIVRRATPGRETEPVLILQAHMDMVCEKDSGVKIDFLKDSIPAYVDGEWVKARGTTLGADCGIGMALQMAALIDPSLECPAIEALFTVDEEQGLTGAMHIGPDMLTGTRMINLDSEDEGEIFIGCAGGIDTLATFHYVPVPAPQNYTYYNIGVHGLHGGHSGDDIEKGFANSNKLLNRILWNLSECVGLVLTNFDGGNLRNAIPRDAEALFGIPKGREAEVESLFQELGNAMKFEYIDTEPQMQFVLEMAQTPDHVMPTDLCYNLLNGLYAVPHGVVTMSRTMPGLVETSTNLASVKMPEPGVLVVTTSQRSSVESAKYDIAAQVLSTFRLAGAVVRHTDGYPGWAPNPASPLVRTATMLYKQLFGNNPKVKAIHAGLECGLLLSKYPGMDIISTGPTLRGVHSPSERIEISSVDKVWRYLRALIENHEN